MKRPDRRKDVNMGGGGDLVFRAVLLHSKFSFRKERHKERGLRFAGVLCPCMPQRSSIQVAELRTEA